MTADELLIAQISDTHIGGAEDPADPNLDRLDRTLAHLCSRSRRPDILLVTGDLAEAGSVQAYALLRERLERCGIPSHVGIGNHDSRGDAQAIFGKTGTFFHYSSDLGPLRLIMLDTLEEGRHGGAFCEHRSAWLSETLAEQPDRPTLIALHHPPIDTGLDWMTTVPSEPWLGRLDAALRNQRQVIGMISGHVHRAITTIRNGSPVIVCPAIASPLTLDLASLDPRAPDDRPLVVNGPPGYALHLWRDGRLTSHFDFVGRRGVLARFDAKMQPLISKIFAERP